MGLDELPDHDDGSEVVAPLTNLKAALTKLEALLAECRGHGSEYADRNVWTWIVPGNYSRQRIRRELLSGDT
jgi:hypothetical protein